MANVLEVATALRQATFEPVFLGQTSCPPCVLQPFQDQNQGDVQQVSGARKGKSCYPGGCSFLLFVGFYVGQIPPNHLSC